MKQPTRIEIPIENGASRDEIRDGWGVKPPSRIPIKLILSLRDRAAMIMGDVLGAHYEGSTDVLLIVNGIEWTDDECEEVLMKGYFAKANVPPWAFGTPKHRVHWEAKYSTRTRRGQFFLLMP